MIGMSYSLPSYLKIMLDNDDDFKNMLCIGGRFDILQFNIEVIDNGSKALVDVARGEFSEFEEDLLLSYCYHKETVLLSASSVNLIEYVGQCFKDGVKGFRNSLCKYSVEVGFNYDLMRNELDKITAESVRTTKHKRMGSDIVSSKIVKVVCDKPLISPIEVRHDFKRKYGLHISYNNASMGVEKARTSLYGDNSESLDQL
ncbi:hypothetical protein L1049_008348 [Liquidambar formosana]|uniref:Uncharacterized protein n=1 Tax=Liquidambar formosana TaxID=63359 RepID=A0AAP0X5J3_LIQFO